MDRSMVWSLVVVLALGMLTGFLAGRGTHADAQVALQDWRECFVMPIATVTDDVVGLPEATTELPSGWSIVGTLEPAGVVLCQ